MTEKTKVVETIEIGMEDDRTVTMRVVFGNAYAAIEWHDRLAASPMPFSLTFSGRKPDIVNMEKPHHPIDSFPVKLDANRDLSELWATLAIIMTGVAIGFLR